MTNPFAHPTYLRSAVIGGAVVGTFALGLSLVVSVSSGAEAQALLVASLPTIRFLASGAMAAAATTLALLLTLLSLSGNVETSLDASFYRRLQGIALIDVVAFVSATLLLLALTLPIQEERGLAGQFYTVAYYAFSAGTATVAGMLIAVVLSIYGAVMDLIRTCWLDVEDVPDRANEPDAEER